MITQEEINQNYVDSPEAARMLDVSDGRIRQLCLKGRFEGALKMGKSWIIPIVTINNFRRNRPGPKPKPTTREELKALISEARKSSIKESSIKEGDNS